MKRVKGMRAKLMALMLIVALAVTQMVPVMAYDTTVSDAQGPTTSKDSVASFGNSNSTTDLATPTIMLSNVTGAPGDTVAVVVDIVNNPGIVSMTLHMNYDAELLTLTNVIDGGILGSQYHKPELVSPYTLCWANDTSTTNYMTDGVLVTLEFQITQMAKGGEHIPVEIWYDVNNYEAYNADLECIDFTIVQGSVEVESTVVEPENPTLISAEIGQYPNKTLYEIGEALDTTGLELLLYYSDGTVHRVTSGFEVGAFDSSTAGEKNVTVYYGEMEFAFTVTVNAAPPIVGEVAGTVYADNITAKPGETISIPICVKDNTGAAYMKFKVAYGDAFELISAEDTGLLGGTFTGSKTIDVNPYVLQWSSAGDMTGNGAIAILTFKVADVLEDGEYGITITFEEAYNQNLEDVTYQIVNPSITIQNFVYGDINDDGRINGKDAIILNQYLSEWGNEINLSAADVNADGRVNGKDAIILNQYLSEWGNQLGKAGN